MALTSEVSAVYGYPRTRARGAVKAMNSGVARIGSPEPTSQRPLTTPPLGAAGATTVVTKRKSGPSIDSAAAATSSFWVDAGASGVVAWLAYNVVGPSVTTRHPAVPARARSEE